MLQNLQTEEIAATFESFEDKEDATSFLEERKETVASKIPEKPETEGDRRILFENLLKKLDSVGKAESIFKLLRIWPPFYEQVLIFKKLTFHCIYLLLNCTIFTLYIGIVLQLLKYTNILPC